MRKINPRHQRIIDQILGIPDVTQAILNKAIYQWRQEHGLCGKPLCKSRRIPNGSLCEYHTKLAREASERHAKKTHRA